MLSRIECTVLTLPQILIVGATMLPIGLPTPVPKQISWQPPAARPVRFSTAPEGASLKCTPLPGRPLAPRPRPITQPAHERALARLGQRAQRLLLDGAKPAALVVGRGLRVAHIDAARHSHGF